ncbi:TIM barrel protein [Vibrio rhizosphaerae]|uniref:TIM barrel protein n=1 Tax=Vibrio rhizosphaerae TaxID=398736 RepID=UPI0005718926|nr:TIM barrel protein [Vibrio rhizosphaerae]
MNLSNIPSLALAHLSVLNVPPLELVSLAAKVGFSDIGLRLYPAFSGSIFYELPEGSAQCRDMQRRLSDEGIGVNDIEFIGIGENFNPSDLQGLLDTAGALGAKRLYVCGDDPDQTRLIDNYARLCELAAPYDLYVELEYMAWRAVKNFEDAFDVVTAAGQSNGGMLIDALHLFRTGGTVQDILRAPDFIHSIQLCDAIAEQCPATSEDLLQEARSGRLAPGQGSLPLKSLLTTLADGTAISLEVPTNSDKPAAQHAQEIFQSTINLIHRVEESLCL